MTAAEIYRAMVVAHCVANRATMEMASLIYKYEDVALKHGILKTEQINDEQVANEVIDAVKEYESDIHFLSSSEGITLALVNDVISTITSKTDLVAIQRSSVAYLSYMIKQKEKDNLLSLVDRSIHEGSAEVDFAIDATRMFNRLFDKTLDKLRKDGAK